MKSILLSFCLILCVVSAQSQIQFLLSGGLHSVDVGAKDFLITNKNTPDSFELAFENASYGYHFGGGIRFHIGNLYLQPELMFNSNKANFKFKDFSTPALADSIRKEKYQYLDLPVIVGFKLGLIRLYAGPVAHFFLKNVSELTDIDGYEDKFKAATFGYQIGLGFDIAFLGIDLRHEGNFSNYGDHVYFFGQRLNFDNSASRLIGTLSLKF